MFHRKWIIAVCFVSLIFSNLGLSAVKQIWDGNLFNSVYSKCIDLVQKGNRSSIDIVGVRYYMRLYSYIQRVIDKRVIPDPAYSIVKLDNEYLDYVTSGKLSPEDNVVCQRYADSVSQLEKRLAEKNIPLVFVMTPVKSHYYDKQTPRGCLQEYTNDKADIFLRYLAQKSVRYYDTREILKNNPDEHYRLFFKGDHHWKPEYALLAFRHFLNDCSKDIPALQEMDASWMNDVSVKAEPFNYWEQFQINKTGELYTEYDREITHYKPNFRTDFTVEIPNINQKNRGSIEEVNLSDYYMHNYPCKIAINHNIPSGRVVLIKDSFGLPWFDYLALSYHEVHMLDLRGFNQSPTEYIEKVKPDIVIVLYHPGVLNKSFEDFFRFTSESKTINPYFQ